MIEAITGLPGAGKTLMMTKILLKERKKYKKNKNFVQITNYKVNLPNVIYIDNDDINNLYEWILQKKYFGASIYLDEASILFPSFEYKSIPKKVILALRQHRHAGYTMYYTAQDLEDVTAGLRRVTQFETQVDGWGFLRFSSYTCYSVRGGKTKYADKYNRGFFLHTKKLFNSYDTHFDVQTPDYLNL